MKKFIGYVFETIVICIVMIIVTFYGIVGCPKNVFATSYQSSIQDKFRILKETDAPKIVIVSGSNAAFGIDQQMLEEATGYKIANLGLHAGFHHIFYSELAKVNINPGDVVLLAYEYNWYDKDQFEIIGTELVMSGIDSDIELYQYVPVKTWPSILGYLGTYAYKKNTFKPVEGQYSREAFDRETGQMTFPREYIMNNYQSDLYGEMPDLSDVIISDETIKYLKKYKAFIESKGAKVYFVSSPVLREAVTFDINAFIHLKYMEEQIIGIPYISNPEDYIYPGTLMSDSIFHCNDRGEKVRTRQLISDLNNAGVIKVRNIEAYQQSEDDKILFEYDLVKYLERINASHYTVFISAKDEATIGLTEDVKTQLRKLGLKIDLTGKLRSSYYAVISNQGIKEDVDNIKLETSGVIADSGFTYSVISAGYDCGNVSSIMIDGIEYSRNGRGLNIVVYNNDINQVVDTVCFDTFSDLSVDR